MTDSLTFPEATGCRDASTCVIPRASWVVGTSETIGDSGQPECYPQLEPSLEAEAPPKPPPQLEPLLEAEAPPKPPPQLEPELEAKDQPEPDEREPRSK